MIYDCFDSKSGRIVSTCYNVAGCRLTGAGLTVASEVVTVASTDALWPGMLVVGKGIPPNTLVLSVDSATTFSMTAVATATVAGGIVVARGYISETVVESLNDGVYRDIFSAVGTVDVVAGVGALQTKVSVPNVGSTLYIENPVVTQTGVGGANPSAVITGDVKASQSDPVSHTAPRPNVVPVSTVYFICTDGAICPAAKYPSYHFFQQQEVAS